MSSRLERVRTYVFEHYREVDGPPQARGVDATAVSQALSIWRNDASSDLNKLCNQGILVKRGKKPVFYYPAAAEPAMPAAPSGGAPMRGERTKAFDAARLGDAKAKTAFRGIVGGGGSLKAQIQMAKAAVLYPPHGLHTLIVGETGVGKSLFAEEMWRYAAENRGREGGGGSIPFVVFNCAEYADNPQLLISQLFGHAKGAYTGANEHKAGLVEKADGGILFLDEIHRLPPTGQEQFFMLIDKGRYRRLGDTADRSAQLMIIGATTEEPSSILLRTFKRRIPVLIQLPTLGERPMNEKISLVGLFLSQEANRLNAAIWISGQAFGVMGAHYCKTNIGELKNALQLCCAKSYLGFLSGEGGRNKHAADAQQPFLSIDVADLPQRTHAERQAVDIPQQDMLTQHVFSEGMTVFPGMSASFETLFDDYELSIDLYGFVEKQISAYRHLNMTQGEVERLVTADLEKYYGHAIKAMHNSAEDEESILHGIISQRIWGVADTILTMASTQLDTRYSKSIQAALALHLQQLKERDKGGHKAFNPDLKYMESKYQTEIAFVRSILPELSRLLDMPIPEDEIGFLSMFLSRPTEAQRPSRVGLIVVAHGRSTATSMADFVNRLLSTDHIVAVNAPINKSVLGVYNELCQAVTDCDQGKGVLLLADMGSFSTMQEDISAKTGVACRVIPNVSSARVLEAGKVVISSNDGVEGIADRVTERYRAYIHSVLPDPQAMERGRETPGNAAPQSACRDAIIAVCATGIGSAKRMLEMLCEHVPAAGSMRLIPLSALSDVKSAASALGDNLRLVVGSFDPHIEGVPFVGVESLLTKGGVGRVAHLLGEEAAMPAAKVKRYSREDAITLIRRQIRRFAPSFPTDKVMAHMTTIAERIEGEIFCAAISMDVMVRIILHSASMLERLKMDDIAPMPTWGRERVRQNRAEFDALKRIVNEEMAAFGYTAPDAELVYMLSSFIDAREAAM
jgi:transcriptional regulator with AAA-type ATPase domain/transcriptional regulatory protein LevR